MTRSPLDLLGRWHLDRDVDDRWGDGQVRVTGTLVLAEDGDAPDRLAWREAGTLWRGEEPADGPGVTVSRDLAVERRADNGWWVAFVDGRDFHPWAPGVEVVHPCGGDTYRGRVEVPAEGPVEAWSVTWEVRGPAKDYTMRTRLTRDWMGPAGVRYSSTAPLVGAQHRSTLAP